MKRYASKSGIAVAAIAVSLLLGTSACYIESGPIELTLVGGGGLRPLGQDRYSLFAGPESAVCAGALECDELAGLVGDERRIRVGFAHPEEPGQPFLITGWMPCTEEQGPCLGEGGSG